MNNLTLKQLRYFEAVASQGHFGRAAAVCAVSQPALSVQIKELETDLGAKLFERDTRKVRLTAFGEQFRRRVADILRAVDELGDLARAAQGGALARLRIGVIPTIAPYLLPAVIADLAQAQPGLDIHVRETLTSRLLDELGQGKLDTAIVALPVSEPSFVEAPLFAEPFMLVRPRSMAHRPVPASTELHTERLLLLEEGHCFRDQALEVCHLPSAAPRDGLDASSLSTLVQMVGAGLGMTLIPAMAVPVETRSAMVSVVPLQDVTPTRTVGMIWRKTSPLADHLRQIADRVRDVAAANLT